MGHPVAISVNKLELSPFRFESMRFAIKSVTSLYGSSCLSVGRSVGWAGSYTPVLLSEHLFMCIPANFSHFCVEFI